MRLSRVAPGGITDQKQLPKAQLYSTGDNYAENLGIGLTRDEIEEVDSLTAVPALKVAFVRTGFHHSAALTEGGDVYTCGYNDEGELGLQAKDYVAVPQLTNSDVSFISGALCKAAIFIKNGHLYRLGEMNAAPFTDKLDVDGKIVSHASMGASPGNHILAVTEDGLMYGRGDNTFGQLGLGGLFYDDFTLISTDGWRRVFAGKEFSFAIDSDGRLFAFGLNLLGQLGLGDTLVRRTPTQVGSGTWLHVACSLDSAAGIMADGSLWGWGNFFDSKTPIKLSEEIFIDVALSSTNANRLTILAVASNNDVFAKGSNSDGQCGTGDREYVGEFAKIQELKLSHVVLGARHALGITHDGELYAWGDNTFGQLGVNNPRMGGQSSVPLKVDSRVWRQIACATYSSYGISGADLFFWGSDDLGQGGDGGKTIPYRIPTFLKVILPSKCKMLAVGEFHNLALLDTGFMYYWGSSQDGQFGDGWTGWVGSPTLNLSLLSHSVPIKFIAAGCFSSMFIDDNGDLYVSGGNWEGEIGLGDVAMVTLFVNTIGVLRGVKCRYADINGQFSYVITEDGKMFSSGWNNFGQLGRGLANETYREYAEIEFAGLGAWKKVSCGGYHVAAMSSSNLLYTCGRGGQGQLGVGNNSDYSRFQQVMHPNNSSGTTWVDVACGNNHTVALDSNGHIYGWGRNDWGQLGLGDRDNRNVPTLISDKVYKIIGCGSGDCTFAGLADEE